MIAADIEDCFAVHRVCVAVRLPHGTQALPISSLDHYEPPRDRAVGIWISCYLFQQPTLAGDSHRVGCSFRSIAAPIQRVIIQQPVCSHNANLLSSPRSPSVLPKILVRVWGNTATQ